MLLPGLIHRVINEVLIEAAVFDGGSDGDRAGDVLWQAEPVSNQLGAA